MKTAKLIGLALLLLVACKNFPPAGSDETDPGDELCRGNTWLQNTVQEMKANADQKGEIIQYRYNNEIVYLVDRCIGCADDMQVVYICTGEERCKFGGIAGFNTCPDFFETATDKKVIWHN